MLKEYRAKYLNKWTFTDYSFYGHCNVYQIDESTSLCNVYGSRLYDTKREALCLLIKRQKERVRKHRDYIRKMEDSLKEED